MKVSKHITTPDSVNIIFIDRYIEGLMYSMSCRYLSGEICIEGVVFILTINSRKLITKK